VKSNEDGSWILGNVLEYNPATMRYLVQDEDEVRNVDVRCFVLYCVVFDGGVGVCVYV